jgi:hypothetical protein
VVSFSAPVYESETLHQCISVAKRRQVERVGRSRIVSLGYDEGMARLQGGPFSQYSFAAAFWQFSTAIPCGV